MTSDKYLWAVRPFATLFNVYWSELQPVMVCGFARPAFALPRNFTFYQIGPDNYPANKWSDALIYVLDKLPVDVTHLVLMLEDYWVCRTVDLRGVAGLQDYIIDKPDVLRIDLTDDRLYAGGMFDVESYGCYDIIETPYQTPYQMSTQAGIWNRRLLRSLLVPGKTAWEVEIHTQPPQSMRVLGSRQRVIAYANALLKGKVDTVQVDRIQEPHLSFVRRCIVESGVG